MISLYIIYTSEFVGYIAHAGFFSATKQTKTKAESILSDSSKRLEQLLNRGWVVIEWSNQVAACVTAGCSPLIICDDR